MEQVEEKTGDPDEELRNAFKEFDKDERQSFYIFLDENSQVSMTRICHNHRPRTNPRYHKGMQSTDNGTAVM